jgi:hypothetical protein
MGDGGTARKAGRVGWEGGRTCETEVPRDISEELTLGSFLVISFSGTVFKNPNFSPGTRRWDGSRAKPSNIAGEGSARGSRSPNKRCLNALHIGKPPPLPPAGAHSTSITIR